MPIVTSMFVEPPLPPELRRAFAAEAERGGLVPARLLAELLEAGLRSWPDRPLSGGRAISMDGFFRDQIRRLAEADGVSFGIEARNCLVLGQAIRCGVMAGDAIESHERGGRLAQRRFPEWESAPWPGYGASPPPELRMPRPLLGRIRKAARLAGTSEALMAVDLVAEWTERQTAASHPAYLDASLDEAAVSYSGEALGLLREVAVADQTSVVAALHRLVGAAVAIRFATDPCRPYFLRRSSAGVVLQGKFPR
jgi:hypothetical protein